MSGKWHLGDERDSWPRQRDFDRYFGLISGATSFFELLQEAGRGRLMLLENTPWTPPSSGYYATDAYTEYAVERIREHRTAHASQPFFMYVAYTAPHFPLHALPEDIARYERRYDAALRQRAEFAFRNPLGRTSVPSLSGPASAGRSRGRVKKTSRRR